MTIHSPVLLGLGLAVFTFGVLLWRWASRHSIDLKAAAISGAFAAVRTGAVPSVPAQLRMHIDAVSAQPTNVGRAKVVGGSVARHFLAKVATMASLIALTAGAAMVALSIFWK